MNFIILYYRHLETICSCVKQIATTYSLIWIILGNDEIYSKNELFVKILNLSKKIKIPTLTNVDL
jgi:hypothetical protein